MENQKSWIIYLYIYADIAHNLCEQNIEYKGIEFIDECLQKLLLPQEWQTCHTLWRDYLWENKFDIYKQGVKYLNMAREIHKSAISEPIILHEHEQNKLIHHYLCCNHLKLKKMSCDLSSKFDISNIDLKLENIISELKCDNSINKLVNLYPQQVSYLLYILYQCCLHHQNDEKVETLKASIISLFKILNIENYFKSDGISLQQLDKISRIEIKGINKIIFDYINIFPNCDNQMIKRFRMMLPEAD